MLQRKYNRSVTDIRKFNFPDNVENSREFFYEITYNISEFLKSIYIRFKDASDEVKSRKLVLTFNHNRINSSNRVSYNYSDFLTNLNWISFGQCHTLEIKPELKRLTVRIFLIFQIYGFMKLILKVEKLEIVTKMNNYIYIHHKGQFNSLNKPPKIQTAKGEMLFANVNHALIHLLESASKTKGQNCSYLHTHDLDSCITKVRKEL